MMSFSFASELDLLDIYGNSYFDIIPIHICLGIRPTESMATVVNDIIFAPESDNRDVE